jgi:hypothetical protein
VTYLTENHGATILTYEQVEDLLRRANTPETTAEHVADAAYALDYLTSSFMPAIRRAARAAKVLEEDDAIQVAVEAFLTLVRTFDADGERPFAPVVPTHLQHAISRADRTNSSIVTVRKDAALKYWRVYHKYDEDADAAYNACRAGTEELPAYSFLAVHNAFNETISFDWTGTRGSGGTGDDEAQGASYSAHDTDQQLGGYVGMNLATPSHEDLVALQDEVRWLFTLVAPLDESILRLYYGFLDDASELLRLDSGYRVGQELSDDQVAHALSRTRPTVNRRRTLALAVMRAALEAEQLTTEAEGD